MNNFEKRQSIEDRVVQLFHGEIKRGSNITYACSPLLEMSVFCKAVVLVVVVFSCLSETKDICVYLHADQCNATTCGLHVNNSCAGALCSCQYLGQPLEKESLRSLVYGGREYQPECDKNPPLFEGASTNKLGTVVLEVYKFKGSWKNRTWNESAFNITFTNVKWTMAHIRFQNLLNESDHPNLFQKSFTRQKEDNVTQFFYDCFWNINYRKSTVKFQYEARDDNTVEVREYRFMIPTVFEVDTQPFMYVDITDHQTLTLWVQGQSPQNYSVELLQDGMPVSQGLISGHSRLLSYSSPPLWSGVYSFRLEDLGQNKTYYSEPPIEVVVNSILIIAAYAVFGIVIILLLLVIIISLRPKGNPPSLLITYAASTDHHVKVIKALTKYLRDHCNTAAYLDVMDIPNSDIKDPVTWYVKAFTTVKFVVFISSPARCLCSGSAGVTYRNMDVVALYLIRECIERGLKTPKIFCVTLPYSSSFPVELSIFHRFNLLTDIDSMLKFLHGASCLQFQIPGGKKHLIKYGQELSKAVKEAQQCSSSCVCGGRQEASSENDVRLLLDRLEEMQLEDGISFESNVPEDTLVVSNIPFPNVLGELNLSGRTYTGMSRSERAVEPTLNIRNWKL